MSDTDFIPRKITLGETEYTITKFRAFKAAMAGALMAKVMREIPQLQGRITEFRKDFRRNNTLVITPAMAKLPRFAVLGLEASDFEVSGNGTVELPEEPDQQTLLMNIFPDLFELASKELQRFLALIVIPNGELADADDADTVEEVLNRTGKRLMRESDIDELLELIVIAQDVLRDQMSQKSGRLGKLMEQIPFLQMLLSTEVESPSPEVMEEMQIEEEPQLPPIAPPSPSDSPTDSDGTDEQLSMVSPGMS